MSYFNLLQNMFYFFCSDLIEEREQRFTAWSLRMLSEYVSLDCIFDCKCEELEHFWKVVNFCYILNVFVLTHSLGLLFNSFITVYLLTIATLESRQPL